MGTQALPGRANAESLLRRLEWTVIRRLDGLLQGDYRTLLRGFGIDLADLREYQAHDDVRYIDWNVTARLQTPHVREFLEDREVSAWFLLDLTGSVNFGSQLTRKRELSAEFVAVIARLLTRHGNRVGAMLYDGRRVAPANQTNPKFAERRACDVIPARVGRRHVLHVLDRLLHTPDHARDPNTASTRTPTEAHTDLAVLLSSAHAVIKRRSVIFVVSDFISLPGWEKALALLARRHEVVAVRLYDPMELELPDLGLVVMQDAETGEQLFVDTHDRRFRARFAESSRRREAALRSALSEAGVDCLELVTDHSLGEALVRFMQLRKRRSQISAGVTATRRIAGS